MKRSELSVFGALALLGVLYIAGACRATHPAVIVAPVRVRPVVVAPVIAPVQAVAVADGYGYAGSAALVAPVAVQSFHAAPLALNVGYGGGVAVVRQRFAVAVQQPAVFVGHRVAVIAPARAAVVVPRQRVIFRR